MAADRQAVSYCNRALGLLGQDPISALLASETATAAHCVVFYEPTKEALLQEFPWRFATKRRQLSLLSDAPPKPWTKQFTLPSDFLYMQQTDESLQPYEIAADPTTGAMRFYAYESTIYIDYTADVDEAYFPAHFQNALVHRLAAALAMPITEDERVASYWSQVARMVCSKAKVTDAAQVPARLMDDANAEVAYRFGSGR